MVFQKKEQLFIKPFTSVIASEAKQSPEITGGGSFRRLPRGLAAARNDRLHGTLQVRESKKQQVRIRNNAKTVFRKQTIRR